MAKTYDILLAGFGGQGILFAGKAIAHAGMDAGEQVSWIPSYGPEMRGGTCNCSIVVSDEPVGCPIVSNPNVLVAMNLPSLDKFEPVVVTGGLVLVDSTLIERGPERADIKFSAIPATQLANDNGFPKLANMIMMGKLLKEADIVSYDVFCDSLRNSIPASKKAMLETNLKAVEIGYNF